MSFLANGTLSGWIDGCPACLDWFVPEAAPREEGGEVDLHLYWVDDSGEPVRPIGTIVMLLRDFDSGWVKRFWSRYQGDAGFREAADAYYFVGQYAAQHHRVPLTMAGDDDQILVDEPVAGAARALQAQGFHVVEARAGGSAARPVLRADFLPAELTVVARDAKFSVDGGCITTQVALSQPAACAAAGQSFVAMLDDWARGELQAGYHYGEWTRAFRPNTLISLPTDAPPRERSAEVLDVIRKSLRGELRFQDLAKLRSGRDAYSRTKTESLLEHLGFIELPATMRGMEEGDARRALRWMCRGFPEGLALRKVAVDQELTEMARQKSKRETARQASE